MLRWLLRFAAAALIIGGIWLLSLPRPASTAQTSSEVRGWVLIALGGIYFFAEYRLKVRADRRSDRAEAREMELHRRKMNDKA